MNEKNAGWFVLLAIGLMLLGVCLLALEGCSPQSELEQAAETCEQEYVEGSVIASNSGSICMMVELDVPSGDQERIFESLLASQPATYQVEGYEYAIALTTGDFAVLLIRESEERLDT